MSVAEGSAASLHKAPYYLELHLLGKGNTSSWWICLEDDILNLVNDSDASVLQLHRGEAARYVRVKHDVFRGRILTFAVGEGLKTYSFRIGKDPLLKLLAWFPHKSPKERLKEVRISSAGVCLFGVLHLVMQPFLAWQWGALLMLTGGWGLTFPGRECYVANGATLVLAGLWSLFPWMPAGLDPRVIPWEERLIPLVAGSLLIIWGIQQFAMLSPNQDLRAARAIRDRKAAFTPSGSRIVRRTGMVALVEAALFGVCTLIALTAWALRSKPMPPDEVDPFLTDIVAVGGLTAMAAGVGAMLLLRHSAVYREAKVAGQLVVITAVLGLWAAGFAVAELVSPGFTGFNGIIGNHLGLLAEPYVWGSFIPCVVLYNRWFVRAVDRELEELRD